jgi:hypothetical protein
MSKEAVAERMLEMITTSERAASIVGDLLEETSNRHALWFWFSSLKIFASHLLQDLRNHWLRMIWLGFSEFLGFVIAGIVVQEILPLRHLPSVPHYLRYAVPILIGWHIARRSRGRELASGISLISVIWIFMAVQVLPLFWIPAGVLPVELAPMQREPFKTLMHEIIRVAPLNAFIILGAIISRYRMNVRDRKLQLS